MTRPLFVMHLPFRGSLMAVFKPLYLLLYDTKAEWADLSLGEGLEVLAHRGGDDCGVLVVCSVEVSSSGVCDGLYAHAKRAFSKPIFICKCSAKNAVVIGEVVGFRISVKKTDDFSAGFGMGVLAQGCDLLVGVGNLALNNGVEVRIWCLPFPVGVLTLVFIDNVGSINIFIRSGTH